jgi:sugar lactone lactonase YvrE
VGHAHGCCVTRYAPDGRIDRVVNLPVRMVTSCTFGGADLDILYVTIGARRLSAAKRDQQPLPGRLLAVRVGSQGLPEPEFGLP